VGRHFGLQQGNCLFPAGFAQIAQAQARTLSCLHGSATLEIRKSESALAIAAIGGAEKGEQGGILADGQKLSIAERPPLGSEVSGEDPDFG